MPYCFRIPQQMNCLSAGNGGGLYVSLFESLTMKSCSLSGNIATGSLSAGAIYLSLIIHPLDSLTPSSMSRPFPSELGDSYTWGAAVPAVLAVGGAMNLESGSSVNISQSSFSQNAAASLGGALQLLQCVATTHSDVCPSWLPITRLLRCSLTRLNNKL